MKFNRRELLKFAGATLSASVAGAGLALADDSQSLSVEHLTLPFSNLPEAFDGYRIGFLTDIHLGAFVSDALVEESLAALAAAKIDLLLLGGDYLWVDDGKLTQFYPLVKNEQFARFGDPLLPRTIFLHLANMVRSYRPRDGAFGVFGNHDRWMGPEACRRSFSRHQVPILQNDIVHVDRGAARLAIIGVDDYWTGIPRPPLARDNGNEFRLLLCHNPDYIGDLLISRRAHFDLALCGHTHGGQIVPPGLGALKFNIDDTRFARGLVALDRERRVYTARGVGVVSVPYRLNCPPEATVFTLRRAKLPKT